MKSIFRYWLLPFIISVGLVFLCRLFFFEIVTVADSNMECTLNKGEKLIFSRISHPKRNKIVCISDYIPGEYKKIFRIIGMPGDSVLISNSLVYVNNKRIEEEKSISYIYTFKSDSLQFVTELLNSNDIKYDKMLARVGFFKVDADLQKLKILKSNTVLKDIKREVEDKNVNLSPIMASEHIIYWNKDHFGPVFSPFKGLRITIDFKSYILYKNLIEDETGFKLINKSGIFLLNGVPIESYTFKLDYYFLMNDKRSDSHDSRIFGLVPENKIEASFLFKFQL